MIYQFRPKPSIAVISIMICASFERWICDWRTVRIPSTAEAQIYERVGGNEAGHATLHQSESSGHETEPSLVLLLSPLKLEARSLRT
jgi:hypothetical protein